jgi:hypothetical protein
MSTTSVSQRDDGTARIRRIARPAFALFFALHGIVHYVGFAVPFGLMTTESNVFTTQALWGRLDLGDGGAKALGVAYLALVVPSLIAAVGIWRDARWALPLVVVVAAVSGVVCALGSPNAIIGLAIDGLVIGLVALAPRVLSSHGRPLWGRSRG